MFQSTFLHERIDTLERELKWERRKHEMLRKNFSKYKRDMESCIARLQRDQIGTEHLRDQLEALKRYLNVEAVSHPKLDIQKKGDPE